MSLIVRRWRTAMAVVAALTVSAACSSEGPGGGQQATPSTQTTDRVSVVTAAATKVIAPAYRDLAKAAAELEAATAACNLERSQSAWRATRVAYSRTFVANGLPPAKDKRLLPAIDFWPADPARVEEFAAGPGPFTLEAVQTLGARQRGLHALEPLLFGQGFLDRQRCQVANLQSVLIRQATDDVAKAWADLAPRFGSQDRALAELVSSTTQAMSLIEGEQLGMPVGLRRGATLNPALVRGRNALEDAAAVAAGAEAVVKEGVAPLLPPEMSGRLLAALEATQDAVDAVPKPLQVAVTTSRPQVLTAIQAAKAVEQMMATEVASYLGVTLNFNPNDGD